MKFRYNNLMGFARTLIALSTFLTLACNSTDMLFKPALGRIDCPDCNLDIIRLSLFCIIKPYGLYIGKIIALLILGTVIIGWRPRITGIAHWWVTFSFFSTATVTDGGDQAATVIAFLLIPICLCDPRKWHWSAYKLENPYFNHVARSAYFILRLQVCIIYFHAAISKLNIAEWLDGTVLYYWFTDPMFGSHYPILSRPVSLIIYNPTLVTIATWSTLLLEILLAFAIVMPRKYWKHLLFFGVFFHFLTALLLGIVSFFIVMSGILIIYLTPRKNNLSLKSFPAFVAIQRLSFARSIAGMLNFILLAKNKLQSKQQ